MLSWIFPGRKWLVGVSFDVFWLKHWTVKVMLKKSFSSHWNLQVLGFTVSKTNVMSVIFKLYFFEHSSIYKFLVSLSYRKELQVALFKNWINLLETKNYFFTYLPFCLFLTEKIIFLSNIFTFGNRNRKFHMCLSLFPHLWQYPFDMSFA